MLTKKEFVSFSTEVEQALQELAKKHNYNIKTGKGKYTDNSFTLELQVAKKEINGKSFEQVEFEKYCSWYGLKPEDYGRQFTSNGSTYTLVGFKPRATKMPVLAVNQAGQRYKFGEDTVKRLLVG